MTNEEWKNRPTTFGLPRPPEVTPKWDWQHAIFESSAPGCWMAKKFVLNLLSHESKYPTFQADRVAVIFIGAEPKVRAYYCYQPISKFTKMIHKAASFRSLCDSQS